MELSTSIDCAREMRGTASRARAVTPRLARASSSSGRKAGLSRLIRVVPEDSFSISLSVGALTFMTTSADHAFAVDTMLAPAFSY